MKVLGIDFETTDSEPKTTLVTEAGAKLYEYVEGTQWPFRELASISEFCYEPDYPALDPFIVDLTGITDEMLRTHGKPRKEVFERGLLPLVEQAEVIFAHKTAFDKTIFLSTCEKFGLTPPEREWICTLTEFEWPKKYTCHKLGHLAWEHGIDVKAADLHRAVNDVELMMQLIAKYDFKQVLAYARSPWIYLKADILGPWQDNGVQKGIAQKQGFSFETCKGTDYPKWNKSWVTRVKSESRVEEIFEFVAKSSSPFRVARIQGIN